MGYRTFGTSGLRVSGLFLAAMTFGELLAGPLPRLNPAEVVSWGMEFAEE